MLARIRRSMKEKDQGFTLIELLVVMIIIGILAAIAIPVFLSQRSKAQDSATKSDVSTLGKELASYYVDGTTIPTVAITSKQYMVNGASVGKVSNNVYFSGNAAKYGADATYTTTGWTSSTWCVALANDSGSKIWSYSATGGLASGACS